jgi:hypothetical protein
VRRPRIGLQRADRYKQLNMIQDADQSCPNAARARDAVVKAMLADQPVPLK